MRDDRRDEPGRLSRSQMRHVVAACRRFRAEWYAGGDPRIGDFLDEVEGPQRSVLLRELMALRHELCRVVGGPHDAGPGQCPPRRGGLARARPLAAGDTASMAAGRSPAPSPPEEAPHLPAEAACEILGELGHGGMGVVYRAFDRRRGQMVALKTIKHPDSAALLRFKREFRNLADISHRNLISLYDLYSDGRLWFYTMELVDGVDFVGYVTAPADRSDETTVTYPAVPRPGLGLGDGAATTADVAASPSDRARATNLSRPAAGRGRAVTASQLARLRDALGQLAEGVAALHSAGKLHRDIKPSNVLVTRRGRVVLLDFGLSAELAPAGLYQSTEPHIVGTVAYMAPEQAAGLPVGPAADWYSVGVMLYEALAGRLPFSGRPLGVLMDKQGSEPPPPRQLAPDIPEDLDSLCADLLRRSPEDRPSGPDVLRRLGGPAGPPDRGDATLSSVGAPLIGRQGHLRALRAAFAGAASGRTMVVLVSGRSGIGKSTLIRAFLEGPGVRDEAVILAGRCYEQESVPFKALDSVVDALGRHLRRLPPAEAEALAPRDLDSLLRLFPALRHAGMRGNVTRRGRGSPDPQESRRRGIAALRELVTRLGDRTPLIVAIDDFQWADLDSILLLEGILRPPDPPSLLLLVAYRSEDEGTAPAVGRLARAGWLSAPPVECLKVRVGPLDHEEATALARSLIGGDDPAASARADAVARESAGHPFFVAELARYLLGGAGATRGGPWAGGVDLDEVLWHRIARLPDEARGLLEVIAVSGRPIGWADALHAAGLGPDDRGALSLLRARRLVRGMGAADHDQMETYHDRVREVVVARLASDVKAARHLEIAVVLERSAADAEVLATHFRSAGIPDKASRYAALAADRAAEALAFERAARLYGLALDLGAADGPERATLQARLGHALANAGHGAGAARAYLEAARALDRAEAAELRRLAAHQFLCGGHLDEGLATLGSVCEATGLPMPRTPLGALASLLIQRLALRCRGDRPGGRPAGRLPPLVALQIDTCLTGYAGLCHIDPVRALGFQARGYRLALGAGDDARLARALANETVTSSFAGARAARRTERLTRATRALAERLGTPYALGSAFVTSGIAEWGVGRWRESLEQCRRGVEILRDGCTGVSWEVNTGRYFILYALFHLGELREFSSHLPGFLRSVAERDDRIGETLLRTRLFYLACLADDEPAQAALEVGDAIAAWPGRGSGLQHYYETLAMSSIHLYHGDCRASWALLNARRASLRPSSLMHIQLLRTEFWSHDACSALANAGRAGPEARRALLRAAEADARRLRRERTPYGEASTELVRAGLDAARGDGASSIERLGRAASLFDAQGMRLHAAAARFRRAQISQDRGDEDAMGDALSWLRDQGVRDPERMLALFAPDLRAIAPGS